MPARATQPAAHPKRAAAVGIIRTLRDAGHAAYLAGGCVRDRLIGYTPDDHDVATDAPPDRVMQRFPRSQGVGAAFGVVLVYTGRPPHRIATEVATFREDADYADGRRPTAVRFTDARTDAQRRDFTINGLFESPVEAGPVPATPDAETRTLDDGSVVIDYVGGLADLQAGIVRAIGDPDQRFGEDYLRMLRAVRFAARLNFALDEPTARAARNAARYLGQVARERVGDELQRMLTGPDPTRAAVLLQQLRLDGPTLHDEHRDAGLPTLAALAGDADAALHDQRRFPALLLGWLLDRHGPDDPPALDRALTRCRAALSLSNDDRATLRRTLTHVRAASDWPTMTVAQRKRFLAAPDADVARAVLRALNRGDTIDADAPALAGDGVGLSPPALVTGDDLIAAGLRPGPAFKRKLDAAYDAQLEGRVTDHPAALRAALDAP